MPSFDVSSKLNLQEVDNALAQAAKEITTRYDFRGTDTVLERVDKLITMRSNSEEKLLAAYDVLQGKFVKRGVSLKAIEAQKVEATGKERLKQELKLVDGIAQDKAKEIVKVVKDSKLKVQAQINADVVRVTGKDRDELQRAIALLRAHDFPVDLQFGNFRD